MRVQASVADASWTRPSGGVPDMSRREEALGKTCACWWDYIPSLAWKSLLSRWSAPVYWLFEHAAHCFDHVTLLGVRQHVQKTNKLSVPHNVLYHAVLCSE